jgi:hypothetical protein
MAGPSWKLDMAKDPKQAPYQVFRWAAVIDLTAFFVSLARMVH